MYVCNRFQNRSRYNKHKSNRETMPIYKHLTIFFTIGIIFLNHSFLFSQAEDSLLVIKGIEAISFEKVVLDGKVSYRNEKTDQFISQSEYLLLRDAGLVKTLHDENHLIQDYSTDYWQSDKVNPYRDVVLPSPFKIEFDQTTFTHPVDNDIIVTSRFGRRRRRPHRGLDLDLVTGDAVRSVLPGKVRFVGYSRGHGKTVVVRHANEVETVYAHLSEYAVSINDIIDEGQVIGKGGNTGRSTGSHLHLEVRYKGVCIHPEYVFNFDGSQSIRGSELWVTKGWKSPRSHSTYRKSKVIPLLTETAALAAQNAEPRYHRVRSGDTLSHIASRYHLGLREISRLNAISTNSVLRIGQLLKIR